MTETDPAAHVARPLRPAALAPSAPTPFELAADAEARGAIATVFALVELPELAFAGEIVPETGGDWRLEGRLRARVVQSCVVTLAPVTTEIAEPVTRRFLAEMPPPGTGEVEMEPDETIEPLGEVIDPGRVMVEALALSLPVYPRAPGAEHGEAVFAAPGVAPLREGDIKPLAGLAELKKRMDDADGSG